jgi:peptidoglycan/LPS O-acetylase OafA/YrhL
MPYFSRNNSLLLDLIRGVSAQVVLIGHAIYLFDVIDISDHLAMQEIAVLVFFILSGFIITASTYTKINKNPSFNFLHFFIDRFARIYPPLVLCLLFALVSDNTIPSSLYPFASNFNIISFLGTLLHLEGFPVISKYLNLEAFGTARPAWSLAVEWWIYMLFGYLVLVIAKIKPIKWFHILILLGLLVCPLGYTFLGHSLCVSWIFGVLVYVAFKKNITTQIPTPLKIFLVLIFIIIGAIKVSISRNEFDLGLSLCIAIAILLALEINKDTNSFIKLETPIRLLAKYSYTLYLTHYTVILLIHSHLPDLGHIKSLILSIVLANVTAFLIGHLGEVILSKRLKRFLYQRFV